MGNHWQTDLCIYIPSHMLVCGHPHVHPRDKQNRDPLIEKQIHIPTRGLKTFNYAAYVDTCSV